jgi:hypothetical protein
MGTKAFRSEYQVRNALGPTPFEARTTSLVMAAIALEEFDEMQCRPLFLSAFHPIRLFPEAWWVLLFGRSILAPLISGSVRKCNRQHDYGQDRATLFFSFAV